MSKNLLPLYKWTGGKRKEIKYCADYFPEFVKNNDKYTYIEPFFGGGALYWYLNNVSGDNIINDLEKDMISFLDMVRKQDSYLLNNIDKISNSIKGITDKEKSKIIDIKEAKKLRGEYFYKQRILDREPGLSNLNISERALRFFIVNQLAFNGMRRFNKNGEFNIPYGNYKSLGNADKMTSKEHVKLLNKTKLESDDFEKVMLDDDNTFIYLDPPYTREFKEYTPGDIFSSDDQIRLSEKFKNLKKSKCMLVINDSDLIRELYDGYIKLEYDIKYGTNIKNRYDRDAIHLLICNY
jgi:DNA adenine methylase